MSAFEVPQSGIEIDLVDGPTEEIVQALKDTIYGTEGKLRYTHTGTSDRIRNTQNLSFFQIKRHQRVLGIAGVIRRSTQGFSGRVTALYIRYLSMPGAFNRIPTKQIKKSGKRGILRDSLSKMFSSLEESIPDGEKAAFYAVVERDNVPSQNMCAMHGFEKVRQMDTHLFSRFEPYTDKQIRLLKEEEKLFFEEKLTAFYSDHTFVFTDTLFTEGTCMVIEKDGKIVGGVKGRPVKWKLLEVPGFSGFMMLKVLPNIPYLKKLFDKEYVRFVALEALWIEKGYEQDLEALIESMCGHFNEHIGILWSDSKSKISRLFKEHVEPGFMSKVQKNVPADLLIRFIGNSEGEKQVYRENPMYISAGDMT